MKTLSRIKTIALFFLAMVCSPAFTQVTTPRTPSPAATFTQTIGISTVTVNYSRPKVNGREVWGKIVPYGWNVQANFGLGNSAPWRAGANENTVIEFSHNAKVEGTNVPAGKYGLFFVINQDNTGEVILSKEYRSWGSFFYDPKQDQLKAKIQLREISMTENLTYDFINLTKTGGELVLNWEKKQFPVKVEFDVDNIVMANAAEELKGPVGFNPQGFTSAANYALLNKVNQEQAIKWVDQAIAQNRTFNALRIKSELLRNTGKAAEADQVLKEAFAASNENELNNYGYQLLLQGNHDKAIEIFTMNTQRFPKSANAFDSLGEGYATKGDKPNAVKNFKKALSLNPPENVRENSEKFLKQLGAM
jgi:hypothetical protein